MLVTVAVNVTVSLVQAVGAPDETVALVLAFTVTCELVFGACVAPKLTSEAVIVVVAAAVFNVTLKVFVLLTKAVFAGSTAFPSVEVS
jgi:hypothetical protein